MYMLLFSLATYLLYYGRIYKGEPDDLSLITDLFSSYNFLVSATNNIVKYFQNTKYINSIW